MKLKGYCCKAQHDQLSLRFAPDLHEKKAFERLHIPLSYASTVHILACREQMCSAVRMTCFLKTKYAITCMWANFDLSFCNSWSKFIEIKKPDQFNF